MKGSLLKWLILLGSIAILSILSLQTFWVYRTWSLREAEFDQKVQAALFRVANNLIGLEGRTFSSHELVEQVSTDYYLVNIDHAFEASDLEYALKFYLESALLQEDFDYYVYDCANDEMLYCNSISYDGTEREILHLEGAPEKDLIYYFGVRFRGRGGFILSSMDMSILFTALLTLAVLFFVVAMFVLRRQNRLAQLQADFINNMTHEFKTPISTIKISSQVFLNDPDIQANPRLLNYASIIAEQNERLDLQVEKVLQISKAGNPALELKKEPLQLHHMVENTVASFSARIETEGAQVDVELLAENDQLLGDKLHLQNILFNLIDNGLKYGGDQPHISMRTWNKSGDLWLSISDQGIGISKDNLGRVFDRFYRIPTSKAQNGFGLGLYYVKKMCDAHGWNLHIESELGKGTQIRIQFNHPS